jgi:hypothetical protein
MKRILFIAFVLLIAVGMNVFAQDWWFLARSEGGSAAPNNTVTLRAGQENFIYITFREASRPKGTFDRIKVDFTMSESIEVFWQCVYHWSMAGSVVGAAGEAGSEGYSTGVRDSGPIETDFTRFTLVWAGNIRTADTSIMSGVCLKIPVPANVRNATFTLTNVEFIGFRPAAE